MPAARTDLTSGHFTLSLTPDAGLFLHSEENYEVQQHTELCGFGNGDFAKSGEAADIMSDATARWALYDLSAEDSLVVLEHSKKLPEHLKEQPWFNKAHAFRIEH